MKTEERIIKYLDNELTTEEKVAFEREMASSQELKVEFQKYISVRKEIEKLKGTRLNTDYIDSILPEFYDRMHTGKKETIRKSLSYAFGVMLIFIIGIAVLRIFFNNQNGPNNIEEFTQSLNENQKIELLENLNGSYKVYNLIPEKDIVNLLEADLEINSDVAEAYDIGYKEIIGNLSDSELEIVYQEILNKNFLEEVPLMKTMYLILIILFISSSSILSQREKWRDDKMRGKFEQLEKIKLIETLEMNEETTLRFFARKSEHQKQQDEIQDKIKEKIDNLEVIFKSGRVATVDELKTNINEINALHSELEKNRTDFINSLSDVLSYDQIAKLLIFERNFRDEIRRLIIKDRKPPMDRE